MSGISFLNQNAIQRRDAENAEISAEKTKTGGGILSSPRHVRSNLSILSSLRFLCVLCVSALKRLPVSALKNTPASRGLQ
jgi:hypothetical protein